MTQRQPRPAERRSPAPPAAPRRFRRRQVAPLVLLLAWLAGGTASLAGEGAPTYRIHKADSPPRIDGDLSDAVWETAAPAFRLTRQEPNPGTEASERTEVRALHDENNVYFAILCRDSKPDQLVVSTKAREGEIWPDDHIRILLDTFFDRRDAYVFEMNPAGSKRDGLAKGTYSDYSWDGIWEGKARRVPEGWAVEIAIPTRTITFKPGLSTWGMNVERQISRLNETDRWASPRADANFSTPALAGVLEGIGELKQGKGLSIRPYATFRSTDDMTVVMDRDKNLDVGFDVYKSIAGNMNAVFTYNTDFAETEADSRQINMTRFPLFIQEKRGFFLEGATIFDFGPDLGTSFMPFFSRRIGLADGLQVPILAGAKLWGRMGSTSVGVLDVQTKEEGGLGSQNLFVARVKQNVLEESSVGVIVTNGNPSGEGANTLVGADFTYKTSRLGGNKNFLAGAWAAYSRNTSGLSRPYGFGFKVDYPNDLIDTGIAYKMFGEGLDPALGFIPRTGVHNLSSDFFYKPRPGFWNIRQIWFGGSASIYWRTEGGLETRQFAVTPFRVIMNSGDAFDAEIANEYESLLEPFEVAEGVVIPAGNYRFNRAGASFETAGSRWWKLEAMVYGGDFYNGRMTQYEAGFTFKPNATLNTTFSFEYYDGQLATGNFIQRLFQWKLTYDWSPDLGLNVFTQYDNVSENVGINARLRWTLKPGTDLFVVWNHGWDHFWADEEHHLQPAYDQVAIKFQYTWRP